MTKELPSPDLLRKLLRYEPDTGKLFWLPRSPDMFRPGNTGAKGRCAAWNAVHAGTEALRSVKDNEYLYGRILDSNFYAHRVAWALHYGRWPCGEIDHINGNRQDNTIENLKEVSHSENAKNQKNRKGRVFSNIYKDKRIGFWVVQVAGKHCFMSKCFGVSMRERNKFLRNFGYSERHISARIK